MTVSAIEPGSRDRHHQYAQKLSSELAARAAARITDQSRATVAHAEQVVAHQRQTDYTRPRYLDVTA